MAEGLQNGAVLLQHRHCVDQGSVMLLAVWPMEIHWLWALG